MKRGKNTINWLGKYIKSKQYKMQVTSNDDSISFSNDVLELLRVSFNSYPHAIIYELEKYGKCWEQAYWTMRSSESGDKAINPERIFN